MRARHRHFNPSSAGSSMVLDARFISGLNDSDAISDWDGRSTSGATASGTSRPTYKNNIINGNPIARFNGSTNRMTPDENDLAGCVFAVVDLASDVNHALIGDFGNNSAQQTAGWFGGNYKFIYTGSESFNSSGQFTFADRTFWNGVAATNSNANAGIAIWDRNNRSAYTFTGASYFFGFSNLNYVYLNGDIGILILLESSPSDSLRKRIEKHMAYSFKIACS